MTKKSFNISTSLFLIIAVAGYMYITSAKPLTVAEISPNNYPIGTTLASKE